MILDGSTPRDVPSARRIHREILQLSALILVTVSAMVATRAFAVHTQRRHAADAEQWYEQGRRALTAGHSAEAIDAFRRAAQTDRGQRTYTLALSRALTAAGETPAAEHALLELRAVAPEDTEVNLNLARLAASRGDLDESVRYYRNALYAPAAAASDDTRRGIRLELIELLLAHDDRSRALSELIAAVVDAPNSAASAITLGRLLLRAGDDRRAADQFARALRQDPRNPDALLGAGTTAFHLERYSEARRDLRTLGANAEARDLLSLADLVLADDPLGRGLTASERARRLRQALAAADQRLDACQAQGTAPDTLRIAAREVAAFAARVSPRRAAQSDVIANGLDLVARAERAAASACSGSTPTDRALLLIAQLHGNGA